MIKKIIPVLFLLFCIQLNVNAIEVKKVEPPFWWANMKNANLQLMVYGEDIGDTEVSTKSEELIIKKVNRVENKNYLFIDLDLSNVKPGEIEFALKGKGKTKFTYEIKERINDTKRHQGFGPEDVIYLLMPDRFANGDSENDSKESMLEKVNRSNPDGRHGGDLKGIINHLDYIKKLGPTTLWINPFQENNNPKYSYHGYAITDFYNTDERYGTNSDYLQLVEQCHNRDMKIIMDIIFNHCGINHWMIKDLPMEDWINQWPEFTKSNFRASTIMDPYASDFDKEKMLKGWFDTNMPDLNQKNLFVRNYLIQNTIWWIEYSGIDGIRLDTQPYSYKEMITEWGERIFKEYPNFHVVGEAWLQKIAITAYFQKDAKNNDGYNSNLPSVTDFPMHGAINNAFNENDTWTDGIARLYYIIAQDFLYAHPDQNVIFVDNHDLNRFFQSVGHDLRKYKMGMTFLLTTRGIPMIYYGTEILMAGEEHKGHGDIRKDFPGGWPNDEKNAFTKDGRTDEQNEAFNFLSNLLNWRNQTPVIHSGKLMHYIPNDGLYVYFRYNEEKTIMVILNNKEEAKEIDLDMYKENIGGKTKAYEVISNQEIDFENGLEIEGKRAMIMELK
jgi:neopullulanase